MDMRRRPPHVIILSSDEVSYLKRLVRNGRTEQRVARRAGILLAMVNPEVVVQQVAKQFEVARHTVWHLCRRYEQVGVQAVFDAPRPGRPWMISPSGAGRD